jgi:hypothetical protein
MMFLCGDSIKDEKHTIIYPHFANFSREMVKVRIKSGGETILNLGSY